MLLETDEHEPYLDDAGSKGNSGMLSLQRERSATLTETHMGRSGTPPN